MYFISLLGDLFINTALFVQSLPILGDQMYWDKSSYCICVLKLYKATYFFPSIWIILNGTLKMMSEKVYDLTLSMSKQK
jgi:hypothetical protein